MTFSILVINADFQISTLLLTKY